MTRHNYIYKIINKLKILIILFIRYVQSCGFVKKTYSDLIHNLLEA
jgi:hypothetical protein